MVAIQNVATSFKKVPSLAVANEGTCREPWLQGRDRDPRGLQDVLVLRGRLVTGVVPPMAPRELATLGDPHVPHVADRVHVRLEHDQHQSAVLLDREPAAATDGMLVLSAVAVGEFTIAEAVAEVANQLTVGDAVSIVCVGLGGSVGDVLRPVGAQLDARQEPIGQTRRRSRPGGVEQDGAERVTPLLDLPGLEQTEELGVGRDGRPADHLPQLGVLDHLRPRVAVQPDDRSLGLETHAEHSLLSCP